MRKKCASSISVLLRLHLHHSCWNQVVAIVLPKVSWRCHSYRYKSHRGRIFATDSSLGADLTDNVAFLSANNSPVGIDKNITARNFPKVTTSIQHSLWRDLIQPYLEKSYSLLKFDREKTKENIIPTLVLILAVSGGSDSVALFHSILSLTRTTTATGLHKQNCTIDKQHHDNISKTIQTANSNQKGRCYLTLSDEILTDEASKHSNNGCHDEKSAKTWLYQHHLAIPCELHVVHFNHEQRGKHSDEDAVFVKNLCRENDVPFHCHTWSAEKSSHDLTDVATAEKDLGRSHALNHNFSQDNARQWRKRHLRTLLSKLVINGNRNHIQEKRWGAILTAHHRDDADETILLKLLRGSHLTNLSGMEARSEELVLGEVSQLDKENLPSHLNSQFVGYFAKPMLGVRKTDIVDYLTTCGHKWRDDKSNSSNKYKRNKVRNQLIPLLCDIAGGEHAFQRRLYNLEQQSNEISQDLTQRGIEYLKTMSSDSAFFLRRSDLKIPFNIVQEKALHLWISKTTNRELQLSYDHMQKIRYQICMHSEKLKWTLDLGDFWRLRRNGNILTVSNNFKHNAHTKTERLSPWKILRLESTVHSTDMVERNTMETEMDIHKLHFDKLQNCSENFSLTIAQVKEVGKLLFTPPWRKDRSAISIQEFLRGQKVPLHCRDHTYVIIFSDDSSKHILAVYLENGKKWILNSMFSHQKGCPMNQLILGKITSEF